MSDTLQSITLVRHGMTEWAADGRHTSVTDIGLTREGREEALALWTIFRDNGHQFDGIYTSPLRRARHTAILTGFTDAETQKELHEWRYGRYEGKTTPEIHQEVPDWTIFRCGAPEGESPEDIQQRCCRLLEGWQEHGHHRVLCFSHGHILRALACCWLEVDLAFGDHLHLDAGSISQLGHEHDTPAIIFWNLLPEPNLRPR
ncbi:MULTISPECIES: histidine phosphatase family protein [Acidithiobacillus]|uniref:Acid phosphatase n=1 Tax=Acidithiobacillus ferridurans TaxID=1232575 RepID=A0A2Z6IGF3_ACIFI|nr:MULTISPECIES: histidine phosphatase family protein [Acidithiobacillus]MBU2852120.1 histidine phosphatase family protein [Acidithiobacillus ferrivorans]MCR2831577.1 histidine phosphatase family protein [Acidithiobacillus ferrooxidans]OFA15264.1 phosphoglycerate mutase [Acidithiobacillus ferrivorans]BBF63864.1 Acid phosphatase [Acidithiobacillus ferridurans]